MAKKYRGINWPFSEEIYEIGQEYKASNGETHVYAGVIQRDKILRQHTREGPEYIPAGLWLVTEDGDPLFMVEEVGSGSHPDT